MPGWARTIAKCDKPILPRPTMAVLIIVSVSSISGAILVDPCRFELDGHTGTQACRRRIGRWPCQRIADPARRRAGPVAGRTRRLRDDDGDHRAGFRAA